MQHMDQNRITLLCLALLLRFLVGLGPYSGAGLSPRYGDYEAQRHWMEIAINLPPTQWYKNSSANDLEYWGLDYPPLSGYQSWLHGKVMSHFEPDMVTLSTSRGFESCYSKLLMRCHFTLPTRLVLAALLFSSDVASIVLLSPVFILIDHGHFQYNCISLGLTLFAVWSIDRGKDVLGSALFVCSFNHKHMSLYYAPAFFGHLFGKCLQQPTPLLKVAKFAKLGATVVATMAAIWFPFLSHFEDFQSVVNRLTPVSRGVFEDYVSNFWCVSSAVVKWKQILDSPRQVTVCSVLTLVSSLPSLISQAYRPSRVGFLYALAASSLGFYLFAYQVHEKSILLPALAVSLLAEWEPVLASSFQIVACFSVYPLLEKDGLVVQYFSLLLFFLSVKSDLSRMALGLPIVGCVLHLLRLCVQAPQRFPFLHDLLFATTSFIFFASTFLYLNVKQWVLMAEVYKTADRRVSRN